MPRSFAIVLSRLVHAVISFAAVLAAYGLYVLSIEPWIEPSIHLSSAGPPAVGQRPFEPPTQRYRELLAPLFPPGSWELDDAKVLKTSHAILLLRDYQGLDSGELRIDGCTVVYALTDEDADWASPPTADDRPAPIVLRAREAILKFDRSFDLRRPRVGRVVAGRLPGPITITRAESHPGAGNALQILTTSVQILPDRIWTPHEVQMTLGSSTIAGRDLTILLESSVGEGAGPSLLDNLTAGVKAIELADVSRVHVRFPTGSPKSAETTPPPPAPRADRPSDLELTCKGPLRVDLANRIATMEDQVDVIQLYPDGASDTLSCSRLSAHFGPRSTGAEPPPRSHHRRGTALSTAQCQTGRWND